MDLLLSLHRFVQIYLRSICFCCTDLAFAAEICALYLTNYIRLLAVLAFYLRRFCYLSLHICNALPCSASILFGNYALLSKQS